MSKSKGNIIYVDTLMSQGYSAEEVRFFLTYGHYRAKMNYSDKSVGEVAAKLRSFRQLITAVRKHAGRAVPVESEEAVKLKKAFTENIDNDLDVKGAFDALFQIMSRIQINELKPGEALGIIRALQKIDKVLQVMF
jgi:cysteinyl-tRNA synthetase